MFVNNGNDAVPEPRYPDLQWFPHFVENKMYSQINSMERDRNCLVYWLFGIWKVIIAGINLASRVVDFAMAASTIFTYNVYLQYRCATKTNSSLRYFYSQLKSKIITDIYQLTDARKYQKNVKS